MPLSQGRASAEVWVLEYEPEQASEIDPLMGWTVSSDMRSQVQREIFQLVRKPRSYAKRNGIPYRVMGEPEKPRVIKKAYSDNFKFGRKHAWTHLEIRWI